MIYLVMKKNGMGNQMFAYSYARSLQEMYRQNGIEEGLAINPSHFEDGRVMEYVDERHLSLHHFYLNDQVVYLDSEEQKKCIALHKKQNLKAYGIVGGIRKKFFGQKFLGEENFIKRSKKGVYQSEESRAYFRSVLSNEKNKFVIGHFQDKRYFDSIRAILKKEFTVKTPPTEANAQYLKKIENSQAVCVHVRRGDYLNPHWKHLNICDYEYYKKAFDKIYECVENPVFYFFSNTHDDLKWIEENYHFTNPKTGESANVEYVDLGNPDYEELRLMKACKHFIIPNSTFSWWAAYLCEYEGSVVCTPDRWDLKIPGDANMNCPEWKVICTGK